MSDSISAQSLPLQTAGRDVPERAQISFLPLHFAVTGLVLAACLSAIRLQVADPPASYQIIAVLTGTAVLGLIAYVRYGLGLPWISGSVVYLTLFWVFHYGLTFTTVVVPGAMATLTEDEIEWLYWPNVRVSMILALIGAAGFVFGVGFFARRTADARTQSDPPAHDSSLYWIGWLVMLMGITASAVMFLQNGGLAVFSLGYLEVLSLMGASPILGIFVDLSRLGCLLALCGAGPRRWMAPLAVWTIVAGIPMLILGLRTDVMVPLVTFVVVLTYRGIHLRRDLLGAAIVAALIVLPAVRAFREAGFANRSGVDWMELTPLDTLTELGGSLRSTKAYVDWIEEGDPYLLGASYWAPFDRQVLTRALPGREQIAWEDDERVPLRMMDMREGAVGGSATGEAYYNFGSAGPFMFFACVGLLFGWLERLARTKPYGCAVLGSMMFVFCFNIRSEWLGVPAQVGQFLVLVGFGYLVSRFVTARVSQV